VTGVAEPAGLPTWVFARGDDRIRLRRDASLTLRLDAVDGPERTFSFPDIDELTAFQCGLEQHLVATGWSLVEFGPERRSGRDRRRTARGGADRRRYPARESAG
jgi:hypothetical protein